MAEVDFIVVTCNQSNYTRRCVESIFSHVTEAFHLIVVDNASSDDTREYLESIKARETGRQKVTLVFQKSNTGYALGLNEGLKHSDAPYVFYCNNDIEVYPGAVAEMIRVAGISPEFGLVNPNSNEFGVKRYDAPFLEKQKGKWTERCHTSGFCVLVKREVIQKIGGIDPAFGPAYFEDMDYAERAKHAGFLCMVALGAYIRHFGTRTFLSSEKQALWDAHKRVFAERWGGTRWFCVYGSEQDFKDESAIERFKNQVLRLARREIAVIHLFLPLNTRRHFDRTHDSLRISESPKSLRGFMVLFKAWRSLKSKPISKIYASQEETRKTIAGFKPLHRADVCTLEKD